MTDEAPQKKLCIECGNEIPVSANLCSECSSFQVGWKNSVRFIANVIGIVGGGRGVHTRGVTVPPTIIEAGRCAFSHQTLSEI